MINVQDLYQTVRTFLDSDHTSRLNAAQFNQYMNLAQSALFDYYRSIIGLDETTFDALHPFYRQLSAEEAKAQDGKRDNQLYLTLVPDIEYCQVQGVMGKDIATGQYVHFHRITPVNRMFSLTRPLRKPSYAKQLFYYEEFINASTPEKKKTISVYLGDGKDKLKDIVVDVLIYPPKANRAVVYSDTPPYETYTNTGTVHLQWPPSQYDNLTDLVLMQAGANARDTLITQFAAGKLKMSSGGD